jgi:hypothetical protein
MARNKYSGQISADFVSGNLFESDRITGPYMCIVGTASAGPSYVLRRVSSLAAAVDLYEDTDTKLIRDIALAFQENPNVNLYCMRIGGTKASVELTQANTNAKLYIQPQYEDAEILEKYRFAMMKSTLSENSTNEFPRLLIYDIEDEIVVYDSDEIVITDLGLFKVTIDSTFQYHEAGLDSDGNPDFVDSANYHSLEELNDGTTAAAALGDSISSTNAISGSVYIAGTDGLRLSSSEKYACLQKAYDLIATRYMDFIVPSDIYVDSANIVDTVSGNDKAAGGEVLVYQNVDWSSGAPTPGDATSDVLGYAWHFRFKAKTYTFMSAASDLFSAAGLAATQVTGSIAAGGAQDADITFDAALKKCLIHDSQYKVNKIKFAFADVPSASPNVVRTETIDSDGVLTISLAIKAGSATAGELKAALEASTYVGTATIGSAIDSEVITNVSTEESAETVTGSNWLTHKELVGEDIPSEVWSKFSNSANSSLREVNFAHQLAQFCYYASSSYHMCLGFVSFKRPTSYNQIDLANYFGELPVYQGWNGNLGNEAIKTPGNGILGNKFMGGAKGYRYAQLKNGSASNGYSFGGFICTKGLGLPNGEGYGIDQNDEKVDRNKFPVDIGRHIVISAAWPTASATVGGTTSTFKTSISSVLAARIFGSPVNREPFGEANGLVNASLSLTSSESSLVSQGYAGDSRVARVSLLNTTNQGLVYLTSISTAAHPIDDYKRISTIRCVNRVVNGLRSLAKGYIGTSFNSANILSLQTAINGYLKSEKDVGVHQGAVAQISYTRADRINGNLKIKLRMIPPFSLETIEVETSILADASEL